MESIEKFVENNINYITKEQIKKVYDYVKKDCYPLYKMKKRELVLEMRYDDISYLDIYNATKEEQFGLSVTAAADQLGISKYKVNKLIENGSFKIIYKRVNCNYAKHIHCNYIKYEDVYNYYLLNKE